MSQLTDRERAELLGVTLEDYYKLTPADNAIATVKQAIAKGDYKSHKNYMEGIDFDEEGFNRGNPVQVPEDVMNSQNLDIYWDKAPETDEEQHLFYGYHIHSKDNPYGLHTHIKGGKLGGAHRHGPQNRLGYHTHAVDIRELPDSFLIAPDSPIYLDGPHEHYMQSPDGSHNHNPYNFG